MNDPHYFFRNSAYDNEICVLFNSIQFVFIVVFMMCVFNKILIKNKLPNYSEFNQNLMLFGYVFLASLLLFWQFNIWRIGEGN